MTPALPGDQDLKAKRFGRMLSPENMLQAKQRKGCCCQLPSLFHLPTFLAVQSLFLLCIFLPLSLRHASSRLNARKSLEASFANRTQVPSQTTVQQLERSLEVSGVPDNVKQQRPTDVLFEVINPSPTSGQVHATEPRLPLLMTGHKFTNSSVGFALFSTYRMSSTHFASCGLALGSAVSAAASKDSSCTWTGSDGETLKGDVLYETTSWMKGYKHTTMCLFCSLQTGSIHASLVAGPGTLIIRLGSSNFAAFQQTAATQLHYHQSTGPFKFDIVFCPSPLQGTLVPASISQWLQYHLALGVDFFFFYDRGAWNRDLELAMKPFSSANLLTVLDFNDQANYEAWYFGQNLAMNDCMLRHRERARWVAFGDLDEYLALPRQAPTTLKEKARAWEVQGWAWVAWGGFWYKNWCQGSLWGRTNSTNEARFAVELVPFRERQAKCFATVHRPEACPSVVGRRKEMVNPRKVSMVMVHQVLRSAPPLEPHFVRVRGGLNELASSGVHFHHFRGITQPSFCDNSTDRKLEAYIQDDLIASNARRVRECLNQQGSGVPTPACFYSGSSFAFAAK